MTAIVVLAKSPRPGAVKTRLCPPLSLIEAADMATASLADTLDLVDQLAWSARILAIDVPDDRWLRPGWFQIRQSSGGLDVRIGNALERASRLASGKPALLIGMDTPHLQAEDLRTARDSLDTQDALIGPTHDGGFWALGLRVADAGLVAGVPMSTADTGTEQRRKLRQAGLSVATAAHYSDIDTIEDAEAAAKAAPALRFAAVLRQAGVG